MCPGGVGGHQCEKGRCGMYSCILCVRFVAVWWGVLLEVCRVNL